MHVSDLADELGLSTVTVVAMCGALGIDARWAGAELSEADADRVRQAPRPAPPTPPPFGSIAPQAWVGPGVTDPEPPGVADPEPPVAPDLSARLAAVGSGSGGFGGRAAVPDPIPLRPGQRGRRDAVIESGWGYWWRSVAIVVATITVAVLVALFLGDVAVVGAAYSHHSGGTRSKVACVVVLVLAGLGWAGIMQIRGAISALDAWNRIRNSEGTIRGRGSVIFLVFSAVLSCTNLAWLVVGGIWAVAIT